MFVQFTEYYVQSFALLVPAIALGLIAYHAQKAQFTLGRMLVTVSFAGLLFGVWFAAASALSLAGILMPPATFTDPPFALMPILIGGPLIWFLGRKTAIGNALFNQASHSSLIAIQMLRVMGFIFLVGWLTGDIPWQFALPAGLGDIWAGLAGISAYRAVQQNSPDARKKLVRANVIGLLDFVVAVGTGVLTTEGFAHIWSLDAPNIINSYPMALFPAFFVPIFLGFHLLSLSKLRAEKI